MEVIDLVCVNSRTITKRSSEELRQNRTILLSEIFCNLTGFWVVFIFFVVFWVLFFLFFFVNDKGLTFSFSFIYTQLSGSLLAMSRRFMASPSRHSPATTSCPAPTTTPVIPALGNDGIVLLEGSLSSVGLPVNL